MSPLALDPWSWIPRRCPTPQGELCYVDSGGDGAPAIFLHGLPTAKELWFPTLAAIGPQIRAIVPDLLGYGGSERPTRRVHHREQAAAIDALRAHLGLSRVHLIAHDLGASVAIDVLRDYAAAIDRLILISAPVYPDFREPAIVRLLRLPLLGPALLSIGTGLLFQVALRRGQHDPSRLSPRLRAAMVAPYAGAAGRRALRKNLWWGRPAEVFADYPAILRHITAPTLVLHGCDDPYIPIEHARRLAALKNFRLTMIPAGSHFLPIDAPEPLAEAILQHLRRPAPERA